MRKTESFEEAMKAIEAKSQASDVITREMITSLKDKELLIRALRRASSFGQDLVGRVYTLTGEPKSEKRGNNELFKFPLIWEGNGSRATFNQWQMGSLLVREDRKKALDTAALTWLDYFDANDQVISSFYIAGFIPSKINGKEVMPIFSFDIAKLTALATGSTKDRKLSKEAYESLVVPYESIRNDEAAVSLRRSYINAVRALHELVDYVSPVYINDDGSLTERGVSAQQGSLVIDPAELEVVVYES